MQLYVGPWHVVIAEIAAAMAVPIENSAVRCEVLFVFCRPMRSWVILPKRQALAWNCSVARQCTSAYCPADTSLPGWAIPLGHLQASSVKPGPGTVGLFPVSKNGGASFWYTLRKWWGPEGCWLNNQAITWYEESIHKLVPKYKCLNVKDDCVER